MSSEVVVSGKDGLKVSTFFEIVLNLSNRALASSTVSLVSSREISSPRLASYKAVNSAVKISPYKYGPVGGGVRSTSGSIAGAEGGG